MEVTIYCDGSSRGNPGPGGFGTILQYIDTKGEMHEMEVSEGYEKTTNNRMELLGAIKGLESLNRPCRVHIISDSKYLTDAFNKHWIDNWAKKGWKKSDKSTVPNNDLWIRLLKASEPHMITYEWIKGHNGHPENERCDKLAVNAATSSHLLVDENYLLQGE